VSGERRAVRLLWPGAGEIVAAPGREEHMPPEWCILTGIGPAARTMTERTINY